MKLFLWDSAHQQFRENRQTEIVRAITSGVMAALLSSMVLFAQPLTSERKLSEIRIRDPYILADSAGSTYYLYAQISNRLGRGDPSLKGVEVYSSRDLEKWTGPKTVFRCPEGFWANGQVWAPEVHCFRGRYYLFVTFTASEQLPPIEGRPPQLRRGTQILVSDSPEGPFQPFQNRAHTPTDWMALDGTLWIEEGVPWMIFCHEWIQIVDGTFELVQLQEDLSAVKGPPVTLFSASQAAWVRSLRDVGGKAHGYISDGPFLYRTKTEKLLMIWSSFGDQRYGIGLARSLSGTVQGPWKPLPEPLFKANGGHGMIFRTFEGELRLVLHQPNRSPLERAQLFQLEDTGDLLKIVP